MLEQNRVQQMLINLLMNAVKFTAQGAVTLQVTRTTTWLRFAVADTGPAVDASRFDSAGGWCEPPEHWTDAIDDRLRAGKLADRIRSAIVDLPPRQREVVTLRDVEGMSSSEVCHVLDISEGNQRVLLHRGRSRVRQVLETEFGRAT